MKTKSLSAPSLPSPQDLARPAGDPSGHSRTPERFRLLLENSVDVIVETTRDGGILYVSANVRNVLGYTVEELLHTSIFERIHPDDLTQMKALFDLPEGQGTCRHRHRSGSWRWIEATGREFVAEDNQVRSVLIVRDITERKEAEKVRHHLEEELNKTSKLSALGLLAGEIAHDFNNILTVINVHLGIAKLESQELEVQDSIHQVELALGQAKYLAQQILQFSRQQNSERKLVQVAAIANEVIQLMRPSWPSELEVVADLPLEGCWVMASPIQLHQVLSNLLGNAVHAMELGGRLEVRVDAVVIDKAYADPSIALASGRYVRLTVSDTGHGMDSATQQRVFEPFFTTKGQGSGLGLAVIQRIVKDHGAALRMSSEQGRGTTFRIYFVAYQDGHGFL
ncbi:MAG TPA: ATP-binding protein [Opitutaceae bacterium]|jgi:PAS domain S-box-containing protein|nr:ATP-binding protein [Opitutaceae bacterium]